MKLFGFNFVREDKLVNLIEQMTEYKRTLEDIGWVNLNLESGNSDIIKGGFEKMIKRSRIYYYNNPLAGHWIQLTTSFTFGKGLELPTAADKKIQEIVDDFWNDPDNKISFTSKQAQIKNSDKLQYEGNLFFVLFVNKTSGKVRVRLLDTLEIKDIICDKDDRKRPVVYKTLNSKKTYNFARDSYDIDINNKFIYYQDHQIADISEYNIPEQKLVENVYIYHVKINCDPNDKFGVPVLYRGMAWLKAHKDMSGDMATYIRSLSTIAWKKKVKGTPAQVSSIKGAMQAKTDLSNIPAAVGSTQVENDGIDLSSVGQSTGGVKNMTDGLKALQLMICSASNIFYHYFGDPSSGNLATATSMELPMVKMFEANQEMWTGIFNDVLQFVINKAIEGKKIPGTFERDTESNRNIYETTLDRFIDIDFQPILSKELDKLSSSLQIGVMNGLITEKAAAQIYMLGHGVNNVSEELEELFPASRKKKEIPAKPKEEEVSIAEAAIEAPDKKMADKIAKKNNHTLARLNGYTKALAGHYRRFEESVAKSAKVSGTGDMKIGNVTGLDGHLKILATGMNNSAKIYYPIAIDIGKKYLLSHTKQLKVKEAALPDAWEKTLLAERLKWNKKFIEESLIPDIHESITATMRMPYADKAAFATAIDATTAKFESRVEQYAGAFWSVEEGAVKEAGSEQGLMANFVGASDDNTCEDCAAAMSGNPWKLEDIPEPGTDTICNGRCFTDPKTRVITNEGWRRIDKIKIGDSVLGHSGKFRKVYEIINMPADKKEVSYEIKVSANLKRWLGWVSGKNKESRLSHRFVVTADHEFLINGSWKKTKDIVANERIAVMAKVCKQCGDLFSITKEGLYSEVCSNDCASKFYKKYKAMHNAESWEKCRKATKKRMLDPKERENISMKIKEVMKNPQRKEINRINLCNRWKNGKDTEVMLNALSRGRQKCRSRIEPSSIEKAMAELLDKLNIKYACEYPIGSYHCDFYLPDFNIIIETDGDYWHSIPACKESDKKKDIFLKEKGYTIIRFKEKQIKNGIDDIKKQLVTTFANHAEDYKLTDGAVVSIKKLKTAPKRLYCLKVKDDESFIVNRGIVSHNCRHAIQILSKEEE